MDEFLAFAAFALLAVTAPGLARLLAGPADTDRIMAIQLLGTAGAAICVLVSVFAGTSGIIDIALIFVTLAALASVALSARPIGPALPPRTRRRK